MKQSTLLDSFIINANANKPQAEVEVADNNSVQNVPKSAHPHKPSSKGKDSEEEVSLDGLKERKVKKAPAAKLEAKVKPPDGGGTNHNRKLSCCKENELFPSEGMVCESAKSPATNSNTEVVAYSEFLTQVTETTKSHDQADCKDEKKIILKSSPKDSNNEKPTMSYNDFLNMFKPATKETASPKEEPEPTPDIIKESETRSILSFFSKSSNSVKVVAEVHSGKDPVESVPSSKPDQLCNDVSNGSEVQSAESNKDSSGTTPRRRSSRISRPVKPFMVSEIVNIDDVEEEAEAKSKEVQRRKRKQEIHKAPKVENPISKQKPKGPLAPIFTAMKPREIAQPPPEDPEKVRLRREFMMSGIPEELKRQMTTSVPTLALDYPPFPKPSHVQQLNQNDSCSLSSKPFAFSVRRTVEDSELQTVVEAHPRWENLEWDATIIPSKKQSFQAQLTLSESHYKDLLLRWQEADPKFKFDKVFGQLKQHLKAQDDCEAQKLFSAERTALAQGEDDVVIIEEEPVKKIPITNIDPNACLWSDLHQPASSEEIVGNSAVVEQLKDWLSEWKKIVQKDFRKACKRSSLQPSRSKGKGSWSDDSDFTDSEDEDERLCNTILLRGPHGVGKTSSVYALAQEMGFKVFEVNSSTLRSGKQILSQLEEATQSHRVAPSMSQQHPLPSEKITVNFDDNQQGESQMKKKAKPPKSAASAFAALFHNPGQQTGKANNSSKPNDGKRGKTEPKTETGEKNSGSDLTFVKSKEKEKISSRKQSKTAEKSERSSKGSKKTASKSEAADKDKSQNLATMSLILFDEVDVVFEEDKGFLSTVEHFMASTKIPIILTSTVAASNLELGARHDQIVFKHPPQVPSVSYLCCVSLAHGVPVARRSVEELWQLLNGDLRKCLLYLQFWCHSGGGRRCYEVLAPCSEQSSHNTALSTSGFEMRLISNTQGSEDERTHKRSWDVHSDDSNNTPFLSLKRPAKRAKRVILDDDEDEVNSNASHQSLEKEDLKHTKPKDRDTDLEAPSRLRKRKKLSTKKAVEDTPVINSSDGQLQQKAVSSLSSSNATDDQKILPLGGVKSGEVATTGSDLKLQLGLVESTLGLENVRLSSETIGLFIQSPTLSKAELERAMEFVRVTDRALGCNSIYQLTLHFSLVPKCEASTVQLTLSAPAPNSCQKKKRRRILESSWLDSDCSEDESKLSVADPGKVIVQDGRVGEVNDEGMAAQTSPPNVAEMELEDHSEIEKSDVVNWTSLTSDEDKTQRNGKPEEAEPVTSMQSRTCLAMLSGLSRYCDSVSLLDTLETFYWRDSKGKQLFPGTSDEDTSPATHTHCFGSVLPVELPGTAGLLASRSLCRDLNANMNALQHNHKEIGLANLDGSDFSLWPDDLCLPVGKSIPEVWGLETKSEQSRAHYSATKNVVSCLGCTVSQSDPSVHTDYLPYLRDICRSENLRHLAKTQRRFHHYLDNVGLSLKKTTVACLTSTYTESPS